VKITGKVEKGEIADYYHLEVTLSAHEERLLIAAGAGDGVGIVESEVVARYAAQVCAAVAAS
jgi:hypothetical protein